MLLIVIIIINYNLITMDHVIHHKIVGLVRPVEGHKSPVLVPGAIHRQNLVSEEFQSHRFVVDIVICDWAWENRPSRRNLGFPEIMN